MLQTAVHPLFLHVLRQFCYLDKSFGITFKSTTINTFSISNLWECKILGIILVFYCLPIMLCLSMTLYWSINVPNGRRACISLVYQSTSYLGVNFNDRRHWFRSFCLTEVGIFSNSASVIASLLLLLFLDLLQSSFSLSPGLIYVIYFLAH